MEQIELQNTASLRATASARSQIDADPPLQVALVQESPNEGRTAWLRVLGCFLVFINSGGIGASFGAYQAYYQLNILSSVSPSSISWIGTTQVFLWGFTGIIAGPLYDRGYLRTLLVAGGLLLVIGQFTLSFAKEYHEIFLAQGICMGLGCGMVYVPGVSIVANTFGTKRSIALGFSATGSAVGGILLPIMFRELEPIVGFGWVNRIFAVLLFSTSVFAFLLLRPDPNHQPRRDSFFDASALKEPPYILLCIGLFLIELGYWIPPFLIAPYAHLSLHTSADLAFYLLAMMNAGGFFGRILPALLSQLQPIGPAWMLVCGSLSLGALVLAWMGIHNVAGTIVWGVLVGFLSGIPVSLPNAVVPRLAPFAAVVGARTGMMWMCVSFATLIGAPVAGLLIDTDTGNYTKGQLFSGLSICVGALLLLVPAHVARKRED